MTREVNAKRWPALLSGGAGRSAGVGSSDATQGLQAGEGSAAACDREGEADPSGGHRSRSPAPETDLPPGPSDEGVAREHLPQPVRAVPLGAEQGADPLPAHWAGATTFKRTVTATVCDNTRDLALSERGQQYKVKHTRYSGAKISPAREALAVVHTLGEDFAKELEILANTPVGEPQWRAFLDAHVSLDDGNGHPLEGRSRTLATRKRGELENLYRHDDRAAPWTGTALGVLQATNTWAHHNATVRRTTRAERNLVNAVDGTTATEDRAPSHS